MRNNFRLNSKRTQFVLNENKKFSLNRYVLPNSLYTETSPVINPSSYHTACPTIT